MEIMRKAFIGYVRFMKKHNAEIKFFLIIKRIILFFLCKFFLHTSSSYKISDNF